MNTYIDIISTRCIKDSEGFVTKGNTVVVSIRAYIEQRHGNETWKNRAAFSSATALFRFRRKPNTEIKTNMIITCDKGSYNILSVEDVKNRGMYTEVLCERVMPSG